MDTFQQALQLHQQGRLDQAEALYRRLLQADPRHADAWHLLGVVALQGGQFDDAVTRIERAVALRPTEHFLCNLGNAYAGLKRRAAAIAAYRRALALNPQMPEALCNLGNELLADGQAREAAELCARAVALRPDFVAAHCNLGNALQVLGQLEQAGQHYQRALQINPQLALAHSHLGDVLQRLGRPDGAVASYRRALQLAPDWADAHARLGTVLRRQGRIEQAITCHVQALKRDAQRPQYRAEFVQSVRGAYFNAPHAEVRAWVLRALQEEWADAAELLTPAVSLIEHQPGLPQALRDDALLQQLLHDELLASVALERLLAAERRRMLAQALAAGDDAAAAALDAAIASQCFINEYVWACSDDEAQQLQQLRARLQQHADQRRLPRPAELRAAAAYAPLASWPGSAAWDMMAWPPALLPLWQQQMAEPAQEAALRETLPSLTAIDDPVSRQVRAQYEAHPYPRWTRLPPAGAPLPLHDWLRRRFAHAALPEAPARPRLDVLVAGCGTGQHPIRAARQFAGAQVLALDLSLASLAYARRKTLQLGLTNIDYAQADLLELGRLQQRFDLIESAGVLHHLHDPLAGWRVLLQLLRPGGVMALALYSEAGRADVLRARAQLQGALPTHDDDIRRLRQQLMQQPAQFERLLASRDFYSTSACRDLLFHVQEHRFTLPQIRHALQQLDLRLIGLDVDADVEAAYDRMHPEDPSRTDLDRWHAFETAHPQTFSTMYAFWVCRKEQ